MSDLNKRLAKLSPEQRELLLKKLKRQSAGKKSERITKRADQSVYPISSSQMRLWFMHQLEPESPFYNIPSALRLKGDLDYAVLHRCINEIIRRHEILRAAFTVDENGEPLQEISPNLELDIPVIDISDTPADKIEDKVRQLLKSGAARPFDITRAPLLRVNLYKLNASEHVLCLNMHHLIVDGWSIGIFINEIVMIYKGLIQHPVQLPVDLHLQFADYASWQLERSGQDIINRQLHYWTESLKGMPEMLDIQTDYPRPDFQTYNGKHHVFTIEKPLLENIRRLAREKKVSLYALLMSAFQVFLYKISGQKDFGVGAPIANRNRTEIEALIGFFVNTIVLRADFSEELTFTEFTDKVKTNILTASDNQDAPFEKIVEAVSGGPQLGHSPLFQVMFDLQKVPFENFQIGYIELEIVDIEIEVAKFDLMLLMLEHNNFIKCTFEYNTDLFSAETIIRYSSCFTNLLQNIIKKPKQKISELSLISKDEERRILTEWNKTKTEYPADSSVQDLFEQQVARTPHAVAVRYDELSYTYEELNSKSNQLAHLLIEKGVKPQDLIALYMDRSMDMIVGFLAILKAGATYVPLDTSYPPERIAFMLNDTVAPLLITKKNFISDVENLQITKLVLDENSNILQTYSSESPGVKSAPLDAAYIMYTSGSTGTPKGSVIPHRAVIRLVKNTNFIDFEKGLRIAQVSNASFDAATFEIWGSLLNGGTLLGVNKETILRVSAFTEKLKVLKIDAMFITSALFNQVVIEDPAAFSSVGTLMVGGDVVDPNSARKVLQTAPPARLLNGYGPTENTTFSAWYQIESVTEQTRSIPIGQPVAHSTCFVLDKKMQVVPVRIPGELYVGGDGLASGYLNRKKLTSERFIKNPFDPSGKSKLYKTGDLVRYLEDGNIEFLARIDQQVKIRGFRIELGEIESILKTYPLLKDAVILARQDKPGEKILTAYIVPNERQEIKTSALRSFLLEKLPDYMVPIAWVELEVIPLTPNGKVDRKVLPAPDQSRPDLEGKYVSPRNSLEQFFCNIWGEILSIDKVGIHDNFFELGGNSLKAAVFANRLQKEFGEVTHVSVVFKAPTIAELAGYIVNYYPRLARERFELDESVNKIYKLVDVSEEITGKIEQAQIDTIRKIITPLSARTETDKTKNHPTVFVLSPPRSGSTLLRVMLAGNKKLFSPPELDLLSFNTLQERHEAFSKDGLEIWLEATIRAIKELKDTDVEDAKKIMADFEAQNFTVKRFYYELQQWMGDKILVDKSPTYPFDPEILKRAEQDFEQPKYIHLLRHPYAMIYSFIEAKLDKNFFRYKHNFTRRELGELIYVISHQNINNFLQDIPYERQFKLKFEEVVQDPYKEMNRLCRFLGIDFEPDMLKPYQGKKMTDGVSESSQMVGDFKFYLRNNIDTGVADRWRQNHKQDFLGDVGWKLAETFDYPVEKDLAAKSASSTTTTLTAIQPLSREKELPLSFAQQRLWFLDQMDPGNPQYNIPGAIRLSGDLNIGLLEKSLNLIIERHETLRTVFSSSDDGKASQIILPQLPLKLELTDAQDIPEKELEELANEEAGKSFNLTTGPLIRARLIQTAKKEHVFMVVMHHIISDGWSVNVFVKELSVFYNALKKNELTAIPSLKIQYADFAGWQREWLSGETLDVQLDYWKKQLQGITTYLELPTDHNRPAVVSHEGKRIVFRFPEKLYKNLLKLSQEQESTLFMTLLTAFQILLYRYSGQDDFTIGTPVANRTRNEIEPLIGFFVNTLVLRSTLSGDRSFSHLLDHVKKMTMEAFDHQDIPFEKLVDALQPERDMSHTPLFQVMFSMQRSDIQEVELQGVSFKPFVMESGTAKFDLNLEMVEHTNRLVAIMEYKTALFTESTIQRILDHFITLLESIIEDAQQNISTLPMLGDEEKKQVLYNWIPAPIDYPRNLCIHQMIEQQAASQPGAFAVGINGESLTFKELNTRANKLASYLLKSGVKKDSIIGILMERSSDMIVSMLAIWKTGGAYLPLDPAYPQERLSFMLEDAQVPVLLTHSLLTENLTDFNLRMIPLDNEWTKISAENPDNVTPEIHSDALAYIIYTSGSTGKPKGVMISHNSALHLAENLKQTVYNQFPDKNLRISLNAPIPFDASVQQIVMLAHGHGLQIIPMEARADGQSMLDYIRRYQIQILDCVPAQLKLMLDAGLLDDNEWKPLAVLPGGEAIDEVTWKKLVDSQEVQFYNMYGPTECTVDSTICNVKTSPERPVIGKPVANARFYILDQNGQPVPVGIAGELHISGAGLARGYLNHPELTSDKFISDPFNKDLSARMYKTGDLVRYLPDGNVEFLGRVDHQVKVRGFRMELGEIESNLRSHENIKDAVVIAREIKAGDKRLVAYLLSENNKAPNVSEIRTFLKKSLPDYMVPAVFMPLESFPLLPNGKVNRKALPEPEFDRSDLGTEYVEAATDREKVFVEIWKAVLGIDQVGIKDNFFELGGDSILSIQVVARANQAGLRITPKQMFENPTIKGLASVAGTAPVIQAEQGVVTGVFPLTAIQQDFFAWNLQNKHHWNQTMMIALDKPLDTTILKQVLEHLISHHDILRARFVESEDSVQGCISETIDNNGFQVIDFSDISSTQIDSELEKSVNQIQASLNLTESPLLRTVYYKTAEGQSDYLLIVIHHLIIDVVSWRILTEDLLSIYSQLSAGKSVKLPPKTTSFKYWAERINEYVVSKAIHSELDFWKEVNSKSIYPLPKDKEGVNTEAATETVRVSLSREETEALLKEAPAAYQTRINEILLTALVRAGRHWHGRDCTFIDLESHGREDLFDDVDISRTIGWFTSAYPMHLHLEGVSDPGESIKSIKEQYRKVPNNGIGFGLLNHLNKNLITDTPRPEIGFNYLGQFQQNSSEKEMLGKPLATPGFERNPYGERLHSLEIGGSVLENVLQITFAYSKEQYFEETIHLWANHYLGELRELIRHCQDPESGAYTPSDFADVALDEEELDDLLEELEE